MMDREDILQGVRDSLGVVLSIDPYPIKEADRVVGDLGADSLDLLDLTFQLERKFNIKISPRDIERRAREKLGEVPLEVDGVYTPEALEELKSALPEIPHSELTPGLTTSALPRCFRVATFVNIIERLMEEQVG